MKSIIVSLLVLAMVVPVFAEKSTELSGSLQYFMPKDDDTYDNGFGIEGQIRFWQESGLGLALAGGLGSFSINAQEAVVSDGLTAAGASIEGDVAMLPIGGSVLYRASIQDTLEIVLEAGVRYVIVDSDAEMSVAAVNVLGQAVGGSGKVEMDNGIIGVLGASVEAELSPGFSLLAGIGYQLDIAKGDATWLGSDIGENELGAFFIRAGMTLEF